MEKVASPGRRRGQRVKAWSMTLTEWLGPLPPVNPRQARHTDLTPLLRLVGQSRHRASVSTALAEGLPVEDRVLADYPELTRREG